MNARPTPLSTPAQALAVVDFWRQSSNDWFSKSARFDRQFRERFLALHEAAASGVPDPAGAACGGAKCLSDKDIC